GGVISGRHLIGDRWVTGEGAGFTSTDPASRTPVWEGRSASANDVERAVNAARGPFEGWAELSTETRQKHLEVFAAQLRAHERELAEIISREVGKPLWESLEEVGAMAGKIVLS